jgi:ferredoxin--NADP+ reductase
MAKLNFIKAELVERIDFTPLLALFRLRPEQCINFIAGQFATLALEENNKLIKRPYSIVSSPREPLLEFFIELVPSGRLTPRIFDLKPGDNIWIRDVCAGVFTLFDTFGFHRHLMAATVTGVAPYISIVRTEKIDRMRARETSEQFLIIHGATSSLEMGCYRDELTTLSREGWLTYIPTVSRYWQDPDWQGEIGRVEDLIRKYADQFNFRHANAIGYACGHPQMIENAKAILMRARFGKEQIQEEKYFIVQAHSA